MLGETECLPRSRGEPKGLANGKGKDRVENHASDWSRDMVEVAKEARFQMIPGLDQQVGKIREL
jgi:hypothetical protein